MAMEKPKTPEKKEHKTNIWERVKATGEKFGTWISDAIFPALTVGSFLAGIYPLTLMTIAQGSFDKDGYIKKFSEDMDELVKKDKAKEAAKRAAKKK